MKTTNIIILLLSTASIALAGGAVDGLNGKLDFSTGPMNSYWGENVAGSISAPLAQNFGLQLDGLYTRVSNRNFDGGGAHLFWRDSEKGLLGVTAGGINGSVLYGLQGGLEGEYYYKRLTFSGDLQAATLQYNNPAPFIDTRPVGVSATAALSYYPVNNLMIQEAYSRMFDNNLGEIVLEYQTPINRLSCFAEFAKGSNGYDHALFGLRFYFGKHKSLIQRHREDDPPNILRRLLYTIGTYGAEFNRDSQAYTAAHPGTGSSGGYGLGMFPVGYSGPPL
jgi:hypothetical protein